MAEHKPLKRRDGAALTPEEVQAKIIEGQLRRPEQIEDIIDILDSVDRSLNVIARYFVRKGADESLWGPEDQEHIELNDNSTGEADEQVPGN